MFEVSYLKFSKDAEAVKLCFKRVDSQISGG